MNKLFKNELFKTALSFLLTIFAGFLIFLSIKFIGETGYLTLFFSAPVFIFLAILLNVLTLKNKRIITKTNFILAIISIIISFICALAFTYYLIVLLIFI